MKTEPKCNILAIIPARGGSKSIKRKNLRFVYGKPLIYYPINVALQSKYVSDVYVTSDDYSILKVAKLLGAKTIKRPQCLAEDDVPLDPVVFHAVNHVEEKTRLKYDIIVTLQPTVPLITAADLDGAIEMLISKNYDTLVFACAATHIYWVNNHDWQPLLAKRANRQFLPKIAKELGAVVTRREYIRPDNRFGSKIGVYLLPEYKGVDIDTYKDLIVAEALLKSYRILFIVEGKRETGLGHIYRCLTLAERFHGHDLQFLTNGNLGKTILYKWGHNVQVADFKKDVSNILTTFKPHVIVNDILDTEKEYIQSLREESDALIVNFEDLGEGANYADLVFNDIYEFSSPPPNHYYGYKYFILREEFRLFPIKKYSPNHKVKTITLLFGGVDPNNLTMKALNALEKLNLKDLTLNVLVGPGYSFLDELKTYIKKLANRNYHIRLHASPDFIADVIYSSDLAITSNGRSLYEIVSYAIPVISIAQNERELQHPFAHFSKGINYLGLASNINEDTIANAVASFINKSERLAKANELLLPYAKEIRKGLNRVLRTILWEVEDRGSD
jgi:CMP-N-acetylneuraminic acid synthetase/spore coat polysaccharide biosynthesis predicted glycosyltransferase SpsG